MTDAASIPRCFCSCHRVPTGGVLCDDVVALIFACEGCKSMHEVVMDAKQAFEPPEPWTPEQEQADGGEGAE